jgi:hypothetical protein
VSTLTATRVQSKPREKTPTTNVDYVVTRGPNSGEPEGLISNFPDRFSETARDIYDLLTWPEGWDDDDAPRPDPTSVRRARSWAEGFYRDLKAGLWIKPHVSADDGGEVTFEWWKGRKKLSVYVSPTAVEYVKVEKLDSSVRVEDGLIDPPKKRLALWHWLTS